MTSRRLAGFVAFAIVATANPTSLAYAQDGGDYGRPAQTPENMVRFALFRFASCAAKNSSITVNKLLTTEIASEAEAKLVKSLRTTARDCYGSDWPGFGPTEVRNAIAEIRYRTAFRSSSLPQAEPNQTPPASFAVPGSKTDGTPTQQAAWYVGGLANCITFVDTKGAHRLVMGPFGVAEEEKRFDQLRPAIAKCSGNGDVAGLTSRLLRGYLAGALLGRMRAEK